MHLLRFSVLCMLFIAQASLASIDVYEFENEAQREQYLDLIRELRCPKCQNQDIADSNAPIAQDMRAAVHRLLNEGKQHDEIVAYMVERFGDFVSYKPKVSSETYLLWYGPWVFLALGALTIVVLSRRSRSRSVDQPVPLNAEEDARLKALLGDEKQIKNKDS